MSNMCVICKRQKDSPSQKNWLFCNLTFKDEAQTALFKDPVRTAL